MWLDNKQLLWLEDGGPIRGRNSLFKKASHKFQLVLSWSFEQPDA